MFPHLLINSHAGLAISRQGFYNSPSEDKLGAHSDLRFIQAMTVPFLGQHGQRLLLEFWLRCPSTGAGSNRRF